MIFQPLPFLAVDGDLVFGHHDDFRTPVPIHIPHVHAEDGTDEGLALPNARLPERTFGGQFYEVRIQVGHFLGLDHGFRNEQLRIARGAGFRFGNGRRRLAPFRRSAEDLRVDVLSTLIDLRDDIVQGLRLGNEGKGISRTGNRHDLRVDADGLPQPRHAAVEHIIHLQRLPDPQGVLGGDIPLDALHRRVRGGLFQHLDLPLPAQTRGKHFPNTVLKIGTDWGECAC